MGVTQYQNYIPYIFFLMLGRHLPLTANYELNDPLNLTQSSLSIIRLLSAAYVEPI